MVELWDVVDEHGKPKGYTHNRELPMRDGDYHLSVSIWIVNKRGEFLISRRATGKRDAGMWETTTGCTLAGEDQITAAIREVKEELGLELNAENCEEFKVYPCPHSDGKGIALITVWIVKQEFDIADVKLQPEETDDAKWATACEICSMMEQGSFVKYDYIGDLFDYLK